MCEVCMGEIGGAKGNGVLASDPQKGLLRVFFIWRLRFAPIAGRDSIEHVPVGVDLDPVTVQM